MVQHARCRDHPLWRRGSFTKHLHHSHMIDAYSFELHRVEIGAVLDVGVLFELCLGYDPVLAANANRNANRSFSIPLSIDALIEGDIDMHTNENSEGSSTS